MSHAITNTNGKNEIAYVGETPWHGLGQELKAGADLQTWLIAAGMDWKIQRSKVRYVVAPAINESIPMDLREWPQQHVLFRSDTKTPLGMVSDHYKPVQPRQVLEFMDNLCKYNGFTMETAGTLKGGAVYWALAQVGEQDTLVGGDKIRGYALLSTSADGTRRTEAKFTTVRVVCNNTLNMSDREKGQAAVCISHRSHFDAATVKTDLGLVHSSFEQFMVSARQLADRKLNQKEATDFVLNLLNGEDYKKYDEAQRQDALSNKHAKAIQVLYYGAGKGAALDSSRGTAWGLVNAVTEYVDHHYPARSDENRLQSAWFGANERLKNSALQQALALV
jgi:phage/plasmid-like protein (TIGR03299 family)